MPNVTYWHPDYRLNLPSFELIRDCLAGETTVKFRRQKYLPAPNDNADPDGSRYTSYLTRAVFYNVAQRTLAGLVGQVFLRDPSVTVPSALNDLVIDATGSGVSLDQVAQAACSLTLAYGRCGLYVDYPSTSFVDVDELSGDAPPVATTIAELETGEVRPTMRVVSALDILNWRVKRRGAKLILSLVVFREDALTFDDGFETKRRDQWRVLRLDANDNYVIEVYRNRAGTEPDEQYYPTDHTGKNLDEITFTFLGAMNNEPNVVGVMPLYDLCSLNMAHYRNSADYEEAVFMLGQPTGWFSGLTEQWVTEVLGGQVSLGARSIIPLPVGAGAGLLQVQPNTLAKEAMDQKEAQMLALGAKLIEASQTQRTATEATYDNVSETSVLSSVAKNVGEAIEWALGKASLFVGVPDATIEYDLNTEFDLVNLTPEERKQLISEWQSGAIAFPEMRANLRRAGVATLTDAQAQKQIGEEDAQRMADAVAQAGALADATTPPDPSAPPGKKPPVAA